MTGAIGPSLSSYLASLVPVHGGATGPELGILLPEGQVLQPEDRAVSEYGYVPGPDV